MNRLRSCNTPCRVPDRRRNVVGVEIHWESMVDTVEQVIKDYIRREFMAEKPEIILTNELPLLQQGIIDSLGIFLLAGFVEERFGVKISEEDVVPENFATVNTIKDLLTGKLTQKISV